MASDKIINYNLRPSKSIERQMLVDVIREVCTPTVAHEYRYIGFGAAFFTDFKLFHKALNISDMISIEGNTDKNNRTRCDFNKPYNCITMRYGMSHSILPENKLWNKKTVVWLDYDKALKPYMFSDIETCCMKSKPGSFLILSLRKEFDQTNYEEFKDTFAEFIPSNLTPEDIQPKVGYKTIRKMFQSKIEETLVNEYSIRDEGEKLIFKQLFNLTYEDGARMYTYGGIFIKKSEEGSFNSYRFNSYNFVNEDDEAFNISFPVITNKEYHELNMRLPCPEDDFLMNPDTEFIPNRASYYNTYKFYPSYIEIKDF